MKKSVIAAAVAAVLVVPTVAMADVSISGGLQAELRSVGGDVPTSSLLRENGTLKKGLYASDAGEVANQNGGSYGFLKFSASEDLGNGLKALAMWNGNVNVGDSNAAGGMTGRDSYVGLAGGWGAVLAGTLSTPYKSSTVGWDPFVTTSMQARGSGGMSDAQNGYASNALAYAGSFGGVKVVAAMVLDEGQTKLNGDGSVDSTAKTTNGKNAISFSVNAPVGPVELAVAYVDASKFSDIKNLGLSDTAAIAQLFPKDGSGAQINSLDTLTATKVGVKWNSGPWTVAGQYEMLELKSYTGGATAAALAGKDIKPTVAYLTASYAMGNNTLSAAYGSTKWDLPSSVGTTDDTKYEAIGLFHHFSKTTSAFVGYRNTDQGKQLGKTVGVENSLSVGMRMAF